MKSIRTQLTLVVLSLLLLLIGMYTIANLWIVSSTLREHQLQDVEMVTESVKSGLIAAMKSGRMDLLHNSVRDMGRQTSLVRLRLLRPNGEVIASSLPRESTLVVSIPPAPELLSERGQAHVGRDEILDGQHVAAVYTRVLLTRECRPCHQEPGPVKAVIQTALHGNETDTMASRIQSVLLLSGLSAFVLAGVLLWFATGELISRPVGKLERSMIQVESGDLSTRAVTGEDEIGRLAARFNTMVAELQNMHRQIEAAHHAELERADRLATVGELAAGVAHEIKNPLAGISGAIEVMSGDMDDSDPNREILEEVLVQVRRVDKTLRDLLSFARLREPRKILADINPVVGDGFSILALTPEQQHVVCDTELAPGLPQVWMDPDQIGQVVLNLLLNAVQAASPKGRVVLRTYMPRNSDRLIIEIEDSGPGIPPEQAEEIFRPFYTTKAKGTGLGLAISRRIARAHGGELVLAPRSALGGARFVLHIPLPAGPGGANIG